MSDAFRNAVFAQPENLRAGARSVREALDQDAVGPMREGTLVFSGVGASAHAMIPAVLALRAAGRRAFIVAPAELAAGPAAALGDTFVLVSQSGASAETLAALERIDTAPMIAISAQANSPLARAAQLWLPLGPQPDTPVATLSYTATLQTLGMLCDALLGAAVPSDWARIPDLAAETLERLDPLAEQLAEVFATVSAVDAVGGGAGQAAAAETALLAREALRLPAAGMETREYLHGPVEAVGDDLGCVIFGGEREARLARDVESFGARVAFITDGAREPGLATPALTLPATGPLALSVLQILPAQLLADHVARRRGMAIGHLRRHQDDTKVAW